VNKIFYIITLQVQIFHFSSISWVVVIRVKQKDPIVWSTLYI